MFLNFFFLPLILGIPPHVDTHSAFDSFILSLSIGSDVIMDFKNMEGHQLSCLLPKRSLLLMANESRYAFLMWSEYTSWSKLLIIHFCICRYGWTHGIVPRKYDVVECPDGLTTQARHRRISFTFRRTLQNHKCQCSFRKLCDSQNVLEGNPSLKIDNGIASELERIHVHEVKIHFHYF